MSSIGETHAQPPQHRSRLLRSMRAVHALLLVSFALWTWAAAPREPAHLVLAGAQLALAVCIVVVGERRWHVVWALGMVLWSMLPVFRAEADLSDGLALGAVMISAMRTLDRRTYLAVTVASVVVDASLRSALDALADLPTSVTLYATIVVYTYVAGMLLETLERSARELDRSEARTAAVAVRDIEDQQRERAISAATRVLHDHVLIALRHAETDGLLPEAQVRRAAAAAVAEVAAFEDAAFEVAVSEDAADLEARSDEKDPLEELLTGLARGCALPLSFEHDIDGAVPELSGEQWDAVGRALTEAVRNAHRHAEASHLRMEIRGAGGSICFTLVDDGRGFAHGAREGVGITESVRAGVGAVGGRVALSSDASGTRVEVAFSSPRETGGDEADPLARHYRQTLAASDGGLVGATTLPFAALWLPVGGWYAAHSPYPLASLTLLALCCLLLVATVHRLGHRPPTTAWLGGFAFSSALLHAFGLSLLGDGALMDPSSWHLSFLVVPLLVVALVVPVPWGVGLIGLGAVLMSVAAAVRPEIGDGQVNAAALYGLLVSPILMLVLGVALRRNARAVEKERSTFFAATTERARRRSFATIGTLRLDHTRRAVVPWLRAVATGELAPSSPDVQTRAELLAREIRDDLHVPGFYSPSLRQVVTDFRSRGGRVDISPGFPAGAHARVSGDLLARLASRLGPDHRIRLSHVGAGNLVRLVLTPPPTAGLLDDVPLPPGVRRSGDAFAQVWDFTDAPGPAAGLPRTGELDRLAAGA